MTRKEKLQRYVVLGQQIHLMIIYEDSWLERMSEAEFLKRLKAAKEEREQLKKELEL